MATRTPLLGSRACFDSRKDAEMVHDIRKQLENIVRPFVGNKKVIADNSRLFHDLGISGDDASELLDKVNAAFGTLFNGFKFNSYFPNETEAFLSDFGRLLRLKSRRKSFTFAHLVQIVQAGSWFEPIE
jgi:hypothetical protein